MAQDALFTTAQKAKMTSAAIAALNNASGNIVTQDVAKLEQNGSLSYNSMLTILDDAASGGMTTGKFNALTSLANSLDKAGGPSTTAYVQQIFDDVVLGNSANAHWTGGMATPVALGNMTATSSQTQVGELVGKWFLGTDLPSTAGYQTANYQTVNLPLYGSSGAPQVSDVSQGQLGDCWFLSALNETVQQDPTLVKDMIQSNGNGTYSVEFQLNGKADYVQ